MRYTMRCNTAAQIPGSDAQNPRYVVNMANMVQYMRSNLVKCTVRDRYGKETARIMEVLTIRVYIRTHLGVP